MTRTLITSAIPYVNGVKHLGNLVGSLLPADVHARFRRQIGDEVLFICGTDDHGTPAELSAAEAGETVAAYCARHHAIQADIYRRFGLSFDHFGRSSSAQNHHLTQHFYRRLAAAGLIEERDHQQYWSAVDGRFLPDRYILGTCPECGDDNARGDQCDQCGALLDPLDLIDPRSAVSGDRDLEYRTSRHLFLRQSKVVDRVRDWIEQRDGWPSWVRALALSWLTEHLRDRCITRDLEWGIPVPRPGFENKVFYVWFDAPIAYISATQEWADIDRARRDWRRWWRDPEEVRYIQFLGKDNVPFHAVSFPVTLLGSGEPWKTVDVIKGFHWLTYEGGKFSTSGKRGVFTDAALDALPADLWRWWLIANAPENGDVDFQIRRFAHDVGKDLADVFGNLATRVSAFAESRFKARIPVAGEPGPDEIGLAREVDARLDALRNHHENLAFRRAAAETRALWTLANGYFQDQAPWETLASDPDRASVATRFAANLVSLCAAVSWGIIPTLASQVLARFADPPDLPPWPHGPAIEHLNANGGKSIHRIPPLVSKLSDQEVLGLEARFGGG